MISIAVVLFIVHVVSIVLLAGLIRVTSVELVVW